MKKHMLKHCCPLLSMGRSNSFSLPQMIKKHPGSTCLDDLTIDYLLASVGCRMIVGWSTSGARQGERAKSPWCLLSSLWMIDGQSRITYLIISWVLIHCVQEQWLKFKNHLLKQLFIYLFIKFTFKEILLPISQFMNHLKNVILFFPQKVLELRRQKYQPIICHRLLLP